MCPSYLPRFFTVARSLKTLGQKILRSNIAASNILYDYRLQAMVHELRQEEKRLNSHIASLKQEEQYTSCDPQALKRKELELSEVSFSAWNCQFDEGPKGPVKLGLYEGDRQVSLPLVNCCHVFKMQNTV